MIVCFCEGVSALQPGDVRAEDAALHWPQVVVRRGLSCHPAVHGRHGRTGGA